MKLQTKLLLATLLLPAALSLAQWQVNPQVYTGIYAGPGPTSVRYAGEYSGANTAFNISSNSADTRIGYATTGVYASNPVTQGGSPANQGYAVIPAAIANAQVTASAPPSYGANQVNVQYTGQVSGQINGQINGRAY